MNVPCRQNGWFGGGERGGFGGICVMIASYLYKKRMCVRATYRRRFLLLLVEKNCKIVPNRSACVRFFLRKWNLCVREFGAVSGMGGKTIFHLCRHTSRRSEKRVHSFYF